MPRIAAAIIVAAMLVFCIGFNTIRYPEVWQMVSPNASPMAPPGVKAPVAEVAGPKSPAEIAPPRPVLTASIAPAEPAPVPQWPGRSLGEPDVQEMRTPARFASARIANYLPDAGETASETGTSSGAVSGERRMVPLPPLSESVRPVGWVGNESDPFATTRGSNGPRRLPPVEPVLTETPSSLPPGSQPMYPTTRPR